MTIRHPREAIAAALITVGLFYARPSAAVECPAPRRIDSVTWAFPDCHIAVINADFERARVLVEEGREALTSCRLERDAARLRCAAELDEVVSTPSPAGDQDLWAWTLAGGLAVAAPVGLCSVGVECGPGYAPWIAAATSLGIVALVGWWVD